MLNQQLNWPRVRVILAATVAPFALVVAPIDSPLATADPGQNCTAPVWITMYSVPFASEVTCYNPDGSYQVCKTLGTTGDGPTNCFNYPAPPMPNQGGANNVNPPVPGLPPPPPPLPGN